MEHPLFPLVTNFFTKLGVVISSITVNQVGIDITIRVESPDSALLIGVHGKNIEIIQHLLSRMIEHDTHEHMHIHLEINDYMKIKDAKLYRFLDTKMAHVMHTHQSIQIPNLTAYERKKAHSYIADQHITDLRTQSEGEGIARILILAYNQGTIENHVSVENIAGQHIQA